MAARCSKARAASGALVTSARRSSSALPPCAVRTPRDERQPRSERTQPANAALAELHAGPARIALIDRTTFGKRARSAPTRSPSDTIAEPRQPIFLLPAEKAYASRRERRRGARCGGGCEERAAALRE